MQSQVVHIKFFASLKDQIGMAETELRLFQPLTAAKVWQQITQQVMPPNTLVAVNQIYAQLDTLVNPGDELAFFPPVTGG